MVHGEPKLTLSKRAPTGFHARAARPNADVRKKLCGRSRGGGGRVGGGGRGGGYRVKVGGVGTVSGGGRKFCFCVPGRGLGLNGLKSKLRERDQSLDPDRKGPGSLSERHRGM